MSYPTSIDTLRDDFVNADPQANDHPNHHNDLADAIMAVETELGTTPSGSFTTVRERLEDIESGGTGDVATDTIWDAKGDLAVGSGADAADNLPVGSNNFALIADSAQTLGIKWVAITENLLSTSDLTTANVSNAKHGFAPKSPADATQFLNGAVTPAWAQVKDSDLSTSDVTTNDVTTAKHGFVPKAPNDNQKFLRGDATWVRPTAAAVTISDAGGYYTGTDVEAALQEVGAGAGAAIPQGGPLTVDLNANSKKITSLADPSSAQDAATKAYVDAGGGAANQDGWISDTGTTWTYASGSGGGTATFTVSGDLTSRFEKGVRVRLKQGGAYKYFVVVASSFASSTTTVTITGGSDYTLANSSITDNYYSRVSVPAGYPGWFAWSPSPTGYSGTPTVNLARFSVEGRTCHIQLDFTGTSNATTCTATAPITIAQTRGLFAHIWVVDSGTIQGSPGNMDGAGGSTTINFYKTALQAAWTNSGTKRVAVGNAEYEI